jgi:hypothetical protein
VDERGEKLYSVIESIYTQQGTNELKAMFGDGKTFDFPKPPALAKKLVQAFSYRDSLILDSFAGSGTTGHAVLQANSEDGGTRRFILVEMDEKIAANVTAERVRRISQGYTNAKGEAVAGLSPDSGGFQFCRLSAEPLFTPQGEIRDDVRYAQLAEFVAAAGRVRGPGDLPALQRHFERQDGGGRQCADRAGVRHPPAVRRPQDDLRRRLPSGRAAPVARANCVQADALRAGGLSHGAFHSQKIPARPGQRRRRARQR